MVSLHKISDNDGFYTSVKHTISHEELGDEVDIPVTATSHLLWGLLFTSKVLVELCTKGSTRYPGQTLLASGSKPI